MFPFTDLFQEGGACGATSPLKGPFSDLDLSAFLQEWGISLFFSSRTSEEQSLTYSCGRVLKSILQDSKQALKCNKVGALIQRFPTVNDFIGFLTSVSFLVCDKGRTLTECFPTFVTVIWFLSSVRPLMPHQGGPLAEGSSTLITFVGVLVGVSSLVLVK